ncbi:MAG: NAD(P)H-binding protein [Clostridiales Family XIII bacterium]|nr:NAD(P)H-binding protein [Clostridiales Family XIII bacterium]
MKIAIIGAGGRMGRLLTAEALGRGHEVLAVVRRKAEDVDARAYVMLRDLYDLTYKDLKGWSTVIDAFGVWEKDRLGEHVTSLRHLANLLADKPERLIVVGSAGSLYVDKAHKQRLLDSPLMPKEYLPLSTAMTAAFDELRGRKDVRWTYLSPPGVFDADGARTGKYRAGRDELLLNAKGESRISYADAAIALIDEAESRTRVRMRFTVADAE